MKIRYSVQSAKPFNFGTYEFDNNDLVNIDGWIPDGEFNPHGVCPWLIYNEYGTLAVVFASHEQDALDEAVDNHFLDSCLVSDEDFQKMDEDEQDACARLGNASEPFNIDNIGLIQLPNPASPRKLVLKAIESALPAVLFQRREGSIKLKEGTPEEYLHRYSHVIDAECLVDGMIESIEADSWQADHLFISMFSMLPGAEIIQEVCS